MRKWIAVVTLIGLLVAICPQIVMADTAVNITITATGSEVDFSCNVTAWDVGVVTTSDNEQTPADGGWFTWGEITNNGSESLDVTIYGENMTDNTTAVNWILSDTATAGAATFGMRAGLTFDNVIIKQELSTPYNYLIEGLAAAASDNFGLEFLAPSSGLGNVEMRMLATGDEWAMPTGLTLTGSIHV